MLRPFAQVDVFTTTPYRGNPLAVVLDGEGLTGEKMQRFAHWTNLSETTFVLPPTVAGADYQVRIFTPTTELPLAGHPTLGTCHAWLAAERTPPGDVAVQQCGAGLVPVRRTGDGLAFAAPPLLRSGPVEEPLVEHIASVLGIAAPRSWTPSGPTTGPGGWPCCWPVRTWCWACAPASWTSTWGSWAPTRRGRRRRSRSGSGDPDGTIWVGGGTVTCVRGQVEL